MLVEVFAMGLAGPQTTDAVAQWIMDSVGAAAWALREATGKKWLLVTGRRDPEGRPGYVTTIRSYDVDTLDEAREAMVADLHRAKRGRRMVDEALGGLRDLQQRKKGG